MNRRFLPVTLREMQRILSYPRLWIVFGIVVGLFAVTGPFGTFGALAFHARLGYWLSVHAVAWLVSIGCAVSFNRALAPVLEPLLLRLTLGAAMATFPVAAAVTILNGAFLGRPVTLAAYGGAAIDSLPVTVAVSLIAYFALEGTDAPGQDATGSPHPTTDAGAPKPVPGASPPERPRLLDRMEPSRRGPLVRIEVQDHYVLVVTGAGREMLLMRFSDAISEAGEGLQVHRSHWVADRAAPELVRTPGRNGRLLLLTADGAEIPVSRNFAAAAQRRFGPVRRLT